MPAFDYPEPHDHETGADYNERLRRMGYPFPWEKDKASPPGPITVGFEWSTRDPGGLGQDAGNEEQARARLAQRPGHTLHKRLVWRAASEWEAVDPGQDGDTEGR